MSAQWWDYVVAVTGDLSQKDIADRTDIDPALISRWKRLIDHPTAPSAIQFARGMHRPPTEALVAAGHLEPHEAAPAAGTTTVELLGTETLLALLGQRVDRALTQEHSPLHQHPTAELLVEVSRRTEAAR